MKILVPVDFSASAANAFRYAVQLADMDASSIQVLHVLHAEAESLEAPLMAIQTTQEQLMETRKKLQQFVDENLSALGNQLKHIPQITSNMEFGNSASRTIVYIAERDDCDLIVMGSRGESRSRIEKLMGAVTSHVVERAIASVLVIPDGAQFQAIERVTYATNVDAADPFKLWQALDVLNPAKPKVDLLHVNIKVEGDPEAWDLLEQIAAFLLGHQQFSNIELHHIPGKDIALEVNGFIESNPTAMLIMYQPQHTFWNRLFHKSTTKSMALHTEVPLLVLKRH